MAGHGSAPPCTSPTPEEEKSERPQFPLPAMGESWAGVSVTRDAAIAVGLIGIAGLYWLGADQIRVSRLEGIVGAQAVPKGLAVCLAILSALLIAQDLWRGRRAAGSHGRNRRGERLLRSPARLGHAADRRRLPRSGRTIGYVPAVALLVVATALYLGQSWSARLAVLAVGLALSIT